LIATYRELTVDQSPFKDRAEVHEYAVSPMLNGKRVGRTARGWQRSAADGEAVRVER